VWCHLSLYFTFCTLSSEWYSSSSSRRAVCVFAFIRSHQYSLSAQWRNHHHRHHHHPQLVTQTRVARERDVSGSMTDIWRRPCRVTLATWAAAAAAAAAAVAVVQVQLTHQHPSLMYVNCHCIHSGSISKSIDQSPHNALTHTVHHKYK